ncbi:MAG: heavy metal transporter [Helicobacteraceae bacterium]|nr:heavy metal transporter [Helicobacteraceae bacterium]
MIKTFEVLNVKCGGCSSTLTKKLIAEGFKDIEVDLTCEPRKVTLDVIDEAHEALLKSTLRKLGYPLVDDNFGFIDGAEMKAKSFVSCAIGKFNQDSETK